MELFDRIMEVIDANLIYCLVPIILTFFLTELLFRNRFQTRKALDFIRWVIVFYAIITGAVTLLEILFYPEGSEFLSRADGSYQALYWLMFLAAFVLPLTLLIKKLATSLFYVLIVATFLKIGVYYERLIIVLTSLHRDHQTENSPITFWDFLTAFIAQALQGFIIGVLIIAAFEFWSRRKST